jgi:hypothetical protein
LTLKEFNRKPKPDTKLIALCVVDGKFSPMNHEHVLQDSKSLEFTPLQTTLADIKERLGYRSARAFFDKHLSERTRLDFNYSYYMKIEGGKINPSSQVISNLCSAFEEADAREILLSYCETIFPERAGVFKKVRSTNRVAKKNFTKVTSSNANDSTQTYLTLAQVGCLSKSKHYYFTFLLLTLARRPIEVTELKKALPQLKSFGEEELEFLIEDFVKAKLIKIDQEKISSISTDMKFPLPETAALQKTYDQMDLWSIAFQQEMQFTSLVQKMMLRRVSSRYLSVIQAHCNVLIDLIRASDEIEPDHNDEVLMFNVSIQQGKLPG